jgi:hypothetical protein
MKKVEGALESKGANSPIRCISPKDAEVRKGDKSRIGGNPIGPNKFGLACSNL